MKKKTKPVIGDQRFLYRAHEADVCITAELLAAGLAQMWAVVGGGSGARCLHGLSSPALDAGFPDGREFWGQSDIENLPSEDPSCGQQAFFFLAPQNES